MYQNQERRPESEGSPSAVTSCCHMVALWKPCSAQPELGPQGCLCQPGLVCLLSCSHLFLCSEQQGGSADYSRWEFPGLCVCCLLNGFSQWKVLERKKPESFSPSLPQTSPSDNTSCLPFSYSFHSCSFLGYPAVPCLSSQNSIICITNLCIKTWNALHFLTRP